jgi:hypothetical protein
MAIKAAPIDMAAINTATAPVNNRAKEPVIKLPHSSVEHHLTKPTHSLTVAPHSERSMLSRLEEAGLKPGSPPRLAAPHCRVKTGDHLNRSLARCRVC